MPNVLRALSEFVSELTWDRLPSAVQQQTRVHLLDTITVVLIGRTSEGTRKAVGLAASGEIGSTGPASFWLSGTTGPADACVFANSVAVHSITHEDGGPGGHPSTTVIPSAIAAAESANASGVDLLAGIAAGYEVQARIGSRQLYGSLASRGHRGTGVSGAFGAAAAAARVFGLGAGGVQSALAFAASLCVPGIEQPILAARSDERLVHMASNARSGAMSALLARSGFVGSDGALEGDSGFFETYAGDQAEVPAQVVDGLGRDWLSNNNSTRPYPTGGWNIGPAYSTLKLVREHAPDADDVERIEVLHTWWGRNTAYVNPGPFATIEQALLSCCFIVACCIIYGGADWETVRRAFADDAVAKLARRVHVDGVATWGLHDGAVTIVMKSGQLLSADARDLPSSLVHPTWAEAVEKLHTLASSTPRDRRDALIAGVEGVAADADGVSRLASLLRASNQDDLETAHG